MFSFMSRNLFFGVIMAMAVGVPYMLHESGLQDLGKLGEWTKNWNSGSKESDTIDDDASFANLLGSNPLADVNGADEAASFQSRGAPISGPEVSDLQTVFRFSTTPEWVMAHWSRVSVIEVDSMRGFRVPLVTGVRLDDVAGSLTYCFDQENRLQRISFRGASGDPRRLEQLVASAYGLKLESASEAGLYLARWNGQPTSYLKIENSQIVRAESPHTRFSIKMEINRPRTHLIVSDELRRVAARTKPDSRWRW